MSQLCSYAGALFADACLKGLNGVPDVVECSYVQSTVTELPFFASKVKKVDVSCDYSHYCIMYCVPRENFLIVHRHLKCHHLFGSDAN